MPRDGRLRRAAPCRQLSVCGQFFVAHPITFWEVSDGEEARSEDSDDSSSPGQYNNRRLSPSNRLPSLPHHWLTCAWPSTRPCMRGGGPTSPVGRFIYLPLRRRPCTYAINIPILCTAVHYDVRLQRSCVSSCRVALSYDPLMTLTRTKYGDRNSLQ